MSLLYFGRHQFYGEYRETKPKMHITTQEIPKPLSRFRGEAVALCGYSRKNTISELRIIKTKPKTSDICSTCLTKREEVSK